MKIKRNIILLVLICILIILVFAGLDLLNITSIIPLTSKYDWLGFVGALIGSLFGGMITYLGVFLTIKYQKESDKEKNRLSNIPILEYKLSYDKTDFDNSNGQLSGESIPHINLENAKYDDKKSEEWYFDLKVTNVGMGHAQITDIKFIVGDNEKKLIQEEKIGYAYKLLKINNTENLRFMIYAPKSRFISNHISGREFIYSIDAIIFYQDLLGNKYEQKIYCGITKSVLIINKNIINKWNTADLYYYDNFNQISL